MPVHANLATSLLMPWWAGLDPDVVQELRARHPGLSLEEIGIAAVRHPDYAAKFERLGVTVWTYSGNGHMAFLYSPDDPDHLEYLERDAAAVQTLVVAAALDGPKPEARRVHPGGARHKDWPRLALEEATRKWAAGSYERSRNAIAKQVTKKVIAEWDPDELVTHGWVTKDFKFTRDAMDLVVEAIDDGLLEWDAEKGLGVFRKFSATPKWLPIPRRKATT